MILTGAGKAPARRTMARSRAVSAVKLPSIWPRPSPILERITGALKTVSSRTMASCLPTLAPVKSPKTRAAFAVEGEGHQPPPLVVGPHLGAGEIGARDHRLPPNDDGPLPHHLPVVVHLPQVQQLQVRRQGHLPLRDVLRIDAVIHRLQFQQRGLADEVDGALRVLDPGQLDHDAPVALRDDVRLGDAELIHAVPDGLQALPDGQLFDPLDFARLERQAQLVGRRARVPCPGSPIRPAPAAPCRAPPPWRPSE